MVLQSGTIAPIVIGTIIIIQDIVLIHNGKLLELIL